MAVVSDTSPLRALNHLGLLPVLGLMFERVYLPSPVAAELAVTVDGTPPIDIAKSAFIEVRAPGPAALSRAPAGIDPGETQAIALATELGIGLILMDDDAGRRAALRVGLLVVGVLGLVLEAKRLGHLPAVGPSVIRLRAELGFRLSESLVQSALARANERPPA